MKPPAQFSMSQFQASFELYCSQPPAEFGRLGDEFNLGYERGARAGAQMGKAIGNVGRAIGEKAVAAKNKVAVLVKGVNGKAFIQQRWKNVADAAGGVGNAAKGVGAVIKANLGKSAAIAGGVAVVGSGLGYLIANPRKLTPQQREEGRQANAALAKIGVR